MSVPLWPPWVKRTLLPPVHGGAEADGAVRSNVRESLAQGVTQTELRAVALLAITTCGFSSAIAGLRWSRRSWRGKRQPSSPDSAINEVVLVRDVLVRRSPAPVLIRRSAA